MEMAIEQSLAISPYPFVLADRRACGLSIRAADFNKLATHQQILALRESVPLSPPPLKHPKARLGHPMRKPVQTLIIAGILALASACSQDSAPTPSKKGSGQVVNKAQEKIPVVVDTVKRKTIPLRLEAIGNVEAFTTVAVKSRVEGQLLNVAFKEGDAVARGQLLFEIDARPFRTQWRQAKANLARDQAQLAYARVNLQRYEGLQAKNFVSGEILQRARTDVEVYEANVEADKASVENTQLLVEYASIKAPLSGYSGKITVHQGNIVKADSILVVINQTDPVRVSFAIPEQRLSALREFAKASELKVKAKIDGAASMPTGRLSFIDNTVDATTGTIKLKASFDNKDQQLWPGQFVRVVLDLKEQIGRRVIPSKATQTGPKGNYVFVIKADGTAAKREIAVERVQDDDTVVASGLEEGETVVVDGQSRLVEGALTEIKPLP